MKKYLWVSVLAVWVAGMAQADLFTQTIDFRSSANSYWNGVWDSATSGKYIAEDASKWVGDHWWDMHEVTLDNDPFNYQHDVTSVIDSEDTINSATVSLYFVDDDTATHRGHEITTEDVRLRFDNGSWVNLGEVDTGSKGPYNVLANLADGILNVRVELVGSDNHEDIYLETSTLSLDYTPGETPIVPVPAAFLLGALGLGTAGMKLRRFA